MVEAIVATVVGGLIVAGVAGLVKRLSSRREDPQPPPTDPPSPSTLLLELPAEPLPLVPSPEPVPQDVVDAATRRLAKLPTRRVPKPSPLPAGSRMPFPVNPLFVGREPELMHLAHKLRSGGAIAVTGIGGLGKSQLASRFVHAYGSYFEGGVFWLSFERADSVAAEVAACGVGLGLHPDFAQLPQEEQVRRVLGAWYGPLPRLLVFDNCEDDELAAEWLPKTGGCRVLLTCRTAQWSPELGVETLSLKTLPRAKSVELLRKHRPDLADPDAAKSLDEVADALGDLPLALHLAGSYLARYRHSALGDPASYLEALQRPDLLDHVSLTEGGYSPTGHEQHVARTFALSYERLDPADATDSLARDLLARAACFAPGEPIPRALLRATVAAKSRGAWKRVLSLLLRRSQEKSGTEPDAERKIEDALGRLVKDLGLLEEDEAGALVLHRLLVVFVKRVTKGFDAARDAVEEAVFQEANRLNTAGYSAPLAAWQGHLRAVADGATERKSAKAGALSNGLGRHLWMIADYHGARNAFEGALAIAEKALGQEHPRVANYVNNLGLVLKDLGNPMDARNAFQRALEIGEKVFGRKHPDIAIYVNNLGLVLQELGDLTGARNAFQEALAINEKVFGDEHPAVATNVNNLGTVLQESGDLMNARKAFERALAIDEKTRGAEHPNVARDVNNLGVVLKELGDLPSAREASERALAIGERILGQEHPDVAIYVNNLSSVLKEMGDLTGARTALERALAIGDKVFGQEHPHVAVWVNNFGLVLKEMGDLTGARAAYQRAYDILRKVFGEEHPKTQTARRNLETLGKGA